ncbi:MAG TPA: hemolysin family protein [Thermoanaerobaculia bacterium]|nr:hemolysin family protein [Thermoanaerobaculia bacterium]
MLEAGWLALALAAGGGVAMVLSALLERSGPVRLRHWAEEAGGGLLALFEHPARFESYRFLLSFLGKTAPVLVAVTLASFLRALGVAWPGWWAVGAVALLVAAVETINRRLVAQRAEASLAGLTVLYRLLRVLLWPAVVALAPLAPADRGGENGEERPDEEEDEVSDEEIEAYIELGTREGILDGDEGDYLWGIVDFGDTQVRSVMTPRVDMVVAAADEDLEALAARFLDSGHSRLPLYEESIDRIAGILHIRDLLRGLRSPEPRPAARELMKAPFFVPERRPLDELLKEMQARFQQMAIVLDEYGGTAGLVTVEDLLEEIVGEIFDEDEVAVASEPVALGDGSWRLDGRSPVDVLDEIFDVDLEEEPYETVAGLVLSVHGQVPEEGAVVVSHGLRLLVEQVGARRIQVVRVEKAVPAVEDGTGVAGGGEEELE